MRDIHTEMIVPIVPELADKIIKFTLKVLIVLTVILGIVVGWLCFLATVVLFFCYQWYKRKTDGEYEYCHTNDSFDIDLVIDAAKRKHLLSVDLEKVIVVAPQDSEHLACFDHVEAKDYTGNNLDAVIYEMVYTASNHKKRKIIICMNDEMLRGLKQWIPSAVK